MNSDSDSRPMTLIMIMIMTLMLTLTLTLTLTPILLMFKGCLKFCFGVMGKGLMSRLEFTD